MLIGMRSSACSPNIPTANSIAPCREWARNSAHACLQKLVQIGPCFPALKRCNAWQALLPSVTNPARSTRFIFAVTAISFCVMPVYLWADLSRARSPWAQVYYKQQCCRGRSHACAIAVLGQRWLKILWKMWVSNTSYNPDFHTKKNKSNMVLGCLNFTAVQNNG
jgi:hypothetical protein